MILSYIPLHNKGIFDYCAWPHIDICAIFNRKKIGA